MRTKSSLEQMLEEELENEKRHSNSLLQQLEKNQTEYIKELQKISRAFEDTCRQMKQGYELILKEELAKNNRLLETYMQSEAVEFQSLKNELERLSKALKNT